MTCTWGELKKRKKEKLRVHTQCLGKSSSWLRHRPVCQLCDSCFWTRVSSSHARAPSSSSPTTVTGSISPPEPCWRTKSSQETCASSITEALVGGGIHIRTNTHTEGKLPARGENSSEEEETFLLADELTLPLPEAAGGRERIELVECCLCCTSLALEVYIDATK